MDVEDDEWLGKLRKVKVKNITFLDCLKVYDEGLKYLLIRCDKVERLYFKGTWLLTSASMILISEKCPNLTEFTLFDNRRVSISSLEELASKCSNLKVLNLRGTQPIPSPLHIAPNGSISLISSLTKLENLSLKLCKEWVDNRLFSPILHFFPHLATLDFQGCIHLTDEALSTLLSVSPALQELDLRECVLVNECLLRIPEMCSKLKVLELRNCLALEDTTFVKICSGCTELRILTVNGCTKLSENALRSLKTLLGFSKIHILALGHSRIANDETISFIFSSPSHSMNKIGILDSQITLHSLSVVSEACPFLQTANFGKSTLSAEDLLNFCKQVVHLKRVATPDVPTYIALSNLLKKGDTGVNLKQLKVFAPQREDMK